MFKDDCLISGKKKEHKPKRLGPDGGGLPCEGMGAKKFGMSLKTQGNQASWLDVLGSSPGYLGGAREV